MTCGQTGHRPIRTCVACRAAVPQAELVRVAVVDGRAVADPRRRQPGRGAYLHARPACLAQAGKGLARTLRRSVSRAELDGLTRAILAPASVLADAPLPPADTARGGGPGDASSRDPAIFPPGEAPAEAVEIGSPSSTRSMSTFSAEGAERSQPQSTGVETPGAIVETITEQ